MILYAFLLAIVLVLSYLAICIMEVRREVREARYSMFDVKATIVKTIWDTQFCVCLDAPGTSAVFDAPTEPDPKAGNKHSLRHELIRGPYANSWWRAICDRCGKPLAYSEKPRDY